MDEIEVVIKIPKWVYDVIVERDDAWAISVADKVKTGVVLPKGHGDLIDRKELLDSVRRFEDFDGDIFNIVHEETIINAPTIIEADKE